ncbi:MAG: hypothetical protein IJ646_09040 [Clostridia bacterium]|nr:hypothetical protein [Clostridia bacterium]
MPQDHDAQKVLARYGDIVYRDRPAHDDDPFSRRHPRMPQINRAKSFAPFDALLGFDEEVQGVEIACIA